MQQNPSVLGVVSPIRIEGARLLVGEALLSTAWEGVFCLGFVAGDCHCLTLQLPMRWLTSR